MYADDVVLFVSPAERDLELIRRALECFGGASGLRTNIDKCSISPIRCTDEHLAVAAAQFPCTVKNFPCTYLGLPLSYKRLPRASLQPVVDTICRRLAPSKAIFYTSAGRLVLIKSVVTAIPIYTSIAMEMPAWLLQLLEKRIRAFFWKGTDAVQGGHCLVAWDKVCRPVEYGGLGIVNLKLFGFALRARWLWLQKLRTGCWTGLPLTVESEVQDMFDASTRVEVGDGRLALFWTDPWLNSTPLKISAPALFAAVSSHAVNRTVEEALLGRQWIRDITGPLTIAVLTQFLLLVDALQGFALTPGTPDRVLWKWTSSGSYSASSAYRAFFVGLEFFPCGKIIWKTWAPAKCKIHIWLAMQRRLWTADRRLRHGLASHTTCPLCDQAPETADHLALGCVVSREIWYTILRRCGLEQLVPGADDSLIEWWPSARQRAPPRARKGFDSLVLLVVWFLWKERNARVFERAAEMPATVCRRIADEVELWKTAGAVGLGQVWR